MYLHKNKVNIVMERYRLMESLRKEAEKEGYAGIFSTDFLEELPIGSVRWKLPGVADLAYIRSLIECSQSCPSDSDESYFLFDDDLDMDEMAIADAIRYAENAGKKKLKKLRQREKKKQEKMKVTETEPLKQSSNDLPSSSKSSSVAAETGHKEDQKEKNKIETKESDVPKKAKANTKKVSVTAHREDKENDNGIEEDSENEDINEDSAFRNYLYMSDSVKGLSKSSKSQMQRKKVDSESNNSEERTMEETDDETILPENYLTFFKKPAKLTCSGMKVDNKKSSTRSNVLGSKDNETDIDRNRLLHASGYFTNEDDTEVDTEFVTVKKSKKPKHLLESGEHSSDAFGVHAYHLILKGNILEAIQYLNEAIHQSPNDIRHYINRSYCYLRQGRYPLALSDARLIVKNSDNPREIARAFCRMGQAFYGMENYEESEKYFEKSINLNPGNPQVQRESLRMQVMKLVRMGFHEKAVVQCIERCSKTLVQEWLDQDVITLLTNDKTATSSNGSVTHSDCDDNDIYCSDDDERPSNARLLSKMISNRLKLYNETSSMDSYSQSSVAGSSSSMPHANKAGTSGMKAEGSKQTVPRVIKAMASQLVKPSGNSVNDKSIWVGNIPAKITNAMLRTKFSKFGNVLSVHRGSNDTYAFINFSNSNAVKKALAGANSCDINGVKLTIKTAQRSLK